MAKPWENKHGVKDPTAYEGSRGIIQEEDRLREDLQMRRIWHG